MSFLRSRLRRAEVSVRGGSCAECELPPDGPGRIVYDHMPEGAEEFCPKCGRRLWFVIEVVGSAAEDEEGGGGRR